LREHVVFHTWTLSSKDVREKIGVIEFSEETIRWGDVECVVIVTPQDLVPGDRSPVKQALWSNSDPFAAVVSEMSVSK
jgi:hypothetical protein